MMNSNFTDNLTDDKIKFCPKCNDDKDKFWIERFGYCFNCKWKIDKEREVARIQTETLKQGYSRCEDYIICPYCAYNCSREEVYESETMNCDECNKKFNVEVQYDINYSTSKISEEKE